MKKKYRHYLPKGWTLEDVQTLASYYDNQTEEEGAAEIEAADDANETFMVVPTRLVPQVQKLIRQHKGKNKTRRHKNRRAA